MTPKLTSILYSPQKKQFEGSQSDKQNFIIDGQTRIIPLKTRLLKKQQVDKSFALQQSSASYKEKIIAKAKQFSLNHAKQIIQKGKRTISSIRNSTNAQPLNVTQHTKNSKSVIISQTHTTGVSPRGKNEPKEEPSEVVMSYKKGNFMSYKVPDMSSSHFYS